MSVTLEKHTVCNLCGSDRQRVLYENKDAFKNHDHYRISENILDKPQKLVACADCGMVYSALRLSEESIKNFYSTMTDELYVDEAHNRLRQGHETMSYIQKHYPQQGTLLDVGASYGFLMQAAFEKGWTPYGVELSAAACDYAQKKLNLANMINKNLEDASFPDNFFDVIVMTDVIEHLIDPKSILMEMKRILKPDGLIYITTPDKGSLVSKVLGYYWWGINSVHLYYFTNKTLKSMLKESGLLVVETRCQGRYISLAYLGYRLQGYSKVIGNIFTGLAKALRINDTSFSFNLGDQMGVLARKMRTIGYLKEKEMFEDKKTDPIRIKNKKVIVVLPAYNAEKTLKVTIDDIPKDIVDEIILVDDCSTDGTYQVAKDLGLTVIRHKTNLGYGGNQKTCYQEALKRGADVVVMVHPDYQYDPRVVGDMVGPIVDGKADVVFASRMMKGGALEGGMPLWKHNTNIILTALANITFKTFLTEYHSGFRAYSRDVLENINFEKNKNNFVFDFEIISQLMYKGYTIEEIPIQTRYFDEASSIKILPAMVYGMGILKMLFKYWLARTFHINFKEFK